MAIKVMLVALAGLLVACDTTEETYPVSGEQCTAEDPVQELKALDCPTSP